LPGPQFPITQTEKSIYSRDRNRGTYRTRAACWKTLVEPDEAMYQMSVAPEAAPDQPEMVEIAFETGTPWRSTAKSSPGGHRHQAQRAGRKAWHCRDDMVEGRLVGMKSHGVYETGRHHPARRPQELESIVLDRDTCTSKIWWR